MKQSTLIPGSDTRSVEGIELGTLLEHARARSADQNDPGHAAFIAAIDNGNIEAVDR